MISWPWKPTPDDWLTSKLLAVLKLLRRKLHTTPHQSKMEPVHIYLWVIPWKKSNKNSHKQGNTHVWTTSLKRSPYRNFFSIPVISNGASFFSCYIILCKDSSRTDDKKLNVSAGLRVQSEVLCATGRWKFLQRSARSLRRRRINRFRTAAERVMKRRNARRISQNLRWFSQQSNRANKREVCSIWKASDCTEVIINVQQDKINT